MRLIKMIIFCIHLQTYLLLINNLQIFCHCFTNVGLHVSFASSASTRGQLGTPERSESEKSSLNVFIIMLGLWDVLIECFESYPTEP